MKIFIILTFVIWAGVAKKSAKKQLKAIKDELIELKGQLSDGLKDLREKQQDLSDGQEELGNKQQELSDGQEELSYKQQELSDGQEELSNKQQELSDGQEELSNKQQELSDGQEELSNKQQELSDGQEELSNKQRELSDGQEQLKDKQQELQEKVESIEWQIADVFVGTWHLGMNINPSDGHIFGYVVGWATGNDIGSSGDALTKDYLSANVWAMPANYIAIVRHQQGVVDAVKVFRFTVSAESLGTRFGLPRMNPGRQIVTVGGPIQESISDDAENLEDDPIFSVGGDLAFNWAYSNNGCRIAMTGGYLSDANVDDDRTRGLGNDLQCIPKENKSEGDRWHYDVSNTQPCGDTGLPDCHPVKVQGTDHGKYLEDGPVYGNYAIYVSQTAYKFPEPGNTLDLKIDV